MAKAGKPTQRYPDPSPQRRRKNPKPFLPNQKPPHYAGSGGPAASPGGGAAGDQDEEEEAGGCGFPQLRLLQDPHHRQRPPPPLPRDDRLSHASSLFCFVVKLVQASDFRNSNAAHDILKQISTLTELSKQLRNELTTVEELKKPSEESKPLPGAVKKEPTNNFQEVNAPNANVIAESLPERAKTSETKDSPKQLEDGFLGSYVIGGSPVGWNFLVYSGIKTVYYGVTKEEFRSRQAAK
uniref:Uncharacterized protein n=1 Tax=Ananas comosus var. bracteatus TaxID=296719 RepID=A0A6V7QNN5_ANACO|nr:unnamed protein product [Ananas comosus var. bracteatus]